MIAVICVVAWAVATATTVLGTWIAVRSFSRRNEPNLALPPVSVLKPLKGMEPGLRKNLESFFLQDYPDFELLFCVADVEDSACAIVRRLMARYPKVRARLIVSSEEVGPNPKVNNLYGAYYRAISDHIVISDSNVRVGLGYLREMVAALGPKTGVVTSLVTATGVQGFGGYLEAAYLNAVLARLMPIGHLVGLPLVLGKSMLLRRSIAEQFGGLDFLGRYLAEDYMTGFAMKHLGLQVALTPTPVEQYIGTRTFKTFWARHVRWGRLRKAHAFMGYLIEPILGVVFPGMLGAWGLHTLLGVHFLTVFTFHFVLWGCCDLVLFAEAPTKGTAANTFGFAGAWFVREWLAIPLWLHTLFGKTVEWRGRRLQLMAGGELRGVGHRSRRVRSGVPQEKH